MHGEPYRYRVDRVVRVVDGDTVDLVLARDVDVGFHVTVHATVLQRVRLLDVDTPERGRPGWADAGAYVREWLAAVPAAALEVETSKSDSFGRYLAVVRTSTACLNHDLVTSGHARRWP